MGILERNGRFASAGRGGSGSGPATESPPTTPARGSDAGGWRCEKKGGNSRDRGGAGLGQGGPGIHFAVGLVHDFEMEMRTAAVSGAPHQSDDIALIDGLAADKVDLAEVGVKGLPAVPVVDDDHQSIAGVVPAGVDDDAVIRGIDGVPLVAGDVDRRMIGGRAVVVSCKGGQ